MKSRILLGLGDSGRQSIHGMVILAGVVFMLGFRKSVLCGAAGRHKEHARGCEHGRAFQAKVHSARTGWICRFSFSETSPGSATSSPCCKPERTSIIVGFAIPTVISVRCKRFFVTTKTNRLRPSIYTAPRG